MALQVGASIVSVRRRVGHFGRASSELHPKAGRFSMGFAFGFQWRAVHASHDLDLRAKVSNLRVVLGVRKLSPHLECAALFRFTDSRMRGGAFVVWCEDSKRPRARNSKLIWTSAPPFSLHTEVLEPTRHTLQKRRHACDRQRERKRAAHSKMRCRFLLRII